MENEQTPGHWGDLSDGEREALLQFARMSEEERGEVVKGAKSRVFWRQFFARLEWLKGVGTAILTLIAVWSVFGEALAEWLIEKGQR